MDAAEIQAATPEANHQCPLCGGPNACAPARCGRYDVACWCTSARFPPELLARVPEAQRGLACICAGCAAQAADELDRAPGRAECGAAEPRDSTGEKP